MQTCDKFNLGHVKNIEQLSLHIQERVNLLQVIKNDQKVKLSEIENNLEKQKQNRDEQNEKLLYLYKRQGMYILIF